jgi:hypothetical protein
MYSSVCLPLLIALLCFRTIAKSSSAALPESEFVPEKTRWPNAYFTGSTIKESVTDESGFEAD